MIFDFAGPPRLFFGTGKVRATAAIAAQLGKRAVLMTGANAERAVSLLTSLRKADLEVLPISNRGEPTVSIISQAAAAARQFEAQVVIGMGGGSALDAAKAIAALVPNAGSLNDYLEAIGKGQPLPLPGLPCLCLPTTAGTGSEATRNAVLTSPADGVKVSLRGLQLIPTAAIVDPELTLPLPPQWTAATGLDALTQLIEPFLSNAANPLTDALCREAIPRTVRALPIAVSNGQDLDARSEMALAAYCSGLALTNARLGVVHGLAAAIGGGWPAPHGMICARLLPEALDLNWEGARQRGLATTLIRFEELAGLITGRSNAIAQDGRRRLRELVSALPVPGLAHWGVSAADFPAIIPRARASSSMRGNPFPPDDAELTQLLQAALSPLPSSQTL